MAASKHQQRPWCGRCSHEPWPRRPVPVGRRGPLHRLMTRPRSTSRVAYRPSQSIQHLRFLLPPADAFPRRVIPCPRSLSFSRVPRPDFCVRMTVTWAIGPRGADVTLLPPQAVSESQKLYDGAGSGAPLPPPAHAPLRHRIARSWAAGNLWKLRRSGTSLTPCTLGALQREGREHEALRAGCRDTGRQGLRPFELPPPPPAAGSSRRRRAARAASRRAKDPHASDGE